MRLICTLDDQKKGFILSNYLKKNGIDNEFEIITNTDWGSSEYGNVSARIWIYEEDQVAKANEILEEFQKNPEDPRFHAGDKMINALLEPFQSTDKEKSSPPEVDLARQPQIQPIGILTLYFLLGCVILFIAALFTSPTIHNIPAGLPYFPIETSAINKALMFDYPKAFEYIDQLVKAYGLERLQNLNDLPPKGINLIKEYYNTPYWHGFYENIRNYYLNQKNVWTLNAPLFEKIQQGQYWRLFSPSLMHYDFFHLLFNMIWLVVLGRQMEARLGAWRYLIFIILTGVLTNIFQYLMGGFSFLGFSGILCAMLSFVWVRQKYAAWEGYQLQPATMGFMMFFIFTLLSIQVASFFMEIYTKTSISPGIGNTAHLTGLAVGLLLGRLNFFAIKNE